MAALLKLSLILLVACACQVAPCTGNCKNDSSKSRLRKRASSEGTNSVSASFGLSDYDGNDVFNNGQGSVRYSTQGITDGQPPVPQESAAADFEVTAQNARRQQQQIQNAYQNEVAQATAQNARRQQQQIQNTYQNEVAQATAQNAKRQQQQIETAYQNEVAQATAQNAKRQQQQIQNAYQNEVAQATAQNARRQQQQIQNTYQNEVAQATAQNARRQQQQIQNAYQNEVAQATAQNARRQQQQIQNAYQNEVAQATAQNARRQQQQIETAYQNEANAYQAVNGHFRQDEGQPNYVIERPVGAGRFSGQVGNGAQGLNDGYGREAVAFGSNSCGSSRCRRDLYPISVLGDSVLGFERLVDSVPVANVIKDILKLL